MLEDKFDNVFFLAVKPNSTWEEETEDGNFTILSLTEPEYSAIIMDLDEEHLVKELEKFQVYNIPERFKSFKLKNSSPDETKTYIIMKKGVLGSE